MNKVAFEFQEVGPIFPSHYQAWVSIEKGSESTTYIFQAYYPDMTFEDFDCAYVPDTAYDHESDILAAFEKRTLYVRASNEILTLFRIPQDADIGSITGAWCPETHILTFRLPRLTTRVHGETIVEIVSETSVSP